MSTRNPHSSRNAGTADPAVRFGWREAVLAAAGALLFCGWALAWDRIGLLHAGPVAYANHEACDAWYYFGLSVLPKAGILTAPGTRTLSRVMYFGVVHGLKALMPGLGISIVSYFAFFPLALAALYVALRSTFARATSVLAVLMLGATPLMLNSMSTTYVTVAAMAYACCSLAGLMWGARLAANHPRASTGLFATAGLFFAWAANANVITIEFTLFFCALALLGRLDRPIFLRTIAQAALKAGVPFLLGVATGVAISMLLSERLGLGLLSPFYQLRTAITGVGDWHYAGWAIESAGLVLAPLGLLLAVAALWPALRGKPARAADLLLVAGAAAATCAANLVATLVIGDQGLVYDYFYFLLLPSIVLAFCAAFDDSIAGSSGGAKAMLLTVVFAFILAFHAAMALEDGVKGVFFSRPYVAPYAALIVLGVILTFGNRRRFATTMAAIMAVTVLLQTAAGKTLMGMYYHPRQPMQRRTEMAEAALGFILQRLSDAPVLWLAKDDDFRLPLPIVRGLQRCRFAGAFPDALPDADANAQPALAPGRTIIVIDGAARNADQIEAALRPYGYRLDIAATRRFVLYSSQSLQITIGKVRRR